MVNPAPAGKCLLQVVNLAKDDVSLKAPGTDLFLQSIKYLEVRRVQVAKLFILFTVAQGE